MQQENNVDNKAECYSFDAIIASRGFDGYKETTCLNAKVGDKVKVEIDSNPKSLTIDPYSCAIKTQLNHFIG